MTDGTEIPSEPVLMVFVGVRANDKKKDYCWVELIDGALPHGWRRQARYWGKQLQSGATPGAIFELQGKRTGENGDGLAITLESGVYKGRLDQEILVAQWQAEHRAQQELIAARSKAKKELRRNLMLERLEPIRLAYQNANYSARHHILAAVIKAVTSTGSLT